MGWTRHVLRIHRVGHSNDHREAQEGRQRFHRPLIRPLHRLHADLQEDFDPPDAKG